MAQWRVAKIRLNIVVQQSVAGGLMRAAHCRAVPRRPAPRRPAPPRAAPRHAACRLRNTATKLYTENGCN
ncbi:unnamed protein product [Spodoptera exigua]|nr:unnamed protein product [Spodoptera exigua]